MTYKIVVLGPQGSGKGTQSALLATRLNLPNISVGNILRNQIKKKTKLGKIAEKYIDEGNLAPSELTIKMVANRLKRKDCKNGFILDGYPRDLEQYEALEKLTNLTHAVEIWISDKEALKRLGKRLSCICGATYSAKHEPPKKNGICDFCGEKLYVRDDDKPKAIKKRLEIYHTQTTPLIKKYKKQKIHIRVNGEQTIEKVDSEVRRKMKLS